MRSLTFRLLPYAIAFAIGIAMYVFSEVYIKNEGLNSLVTNVASGLVSVPLVFISYEIIKEFCDRKVNTEIASHLYFELNASVIHILSSLRLLTGAGELTPENLEDFIQTPRNTLKKTVKPEASLAEAFLKEKLAISDSIRNSKHTEVLPGDDIRDILEISRQAGMLSLELTHLDKKENMSDLVSTLSSFFDVLDRWLESQEDNIVKHHEFQFINHNHLPTNSLPA